MKLRDFDDDDGDDVARGMLSKRRRSVDVLVKRCLCSNTCVDEVVRFHVSLLL